MRPARRAAALLAVCSGLVACGPEAPDVAVGTLERDRIELVAEAQEPIVEIAAREGDVLRAGDLVLRLDPRRMRAQLDAAEGERARAAARLAELERGPRAERIAEARARLAGAKSRVEKTHRDLERAEALARSEVVSQSRLDSLRASWEEAQAAREEAAAALDALVDGTTAEELAQGRAALAAAEAHAEDLRVRLERMEVRAPGDARLDALPFELGERPPPGAVVAVLLAGRTPYARVYVPAAVRPGVQPGTSAQVRIDGVDGAFEGRVRTVSDDASFTPYFALTERDRGRLAYVAEVDLIGERAHALPTGLPVEVTFEPARTARETPPPPAEPPR